MAWGLYERLVPTRLGLRVWFGETNVALTEMANCYETYIQHEAQLCLVFIPLQGANVQCAKWLCLPYEVRFGNFNSIWNPKYTIRKVFVAPSIYALGTGSGLNGFVQVSSLGPIRNLYHLQKRKVHIQREKRSVATDSWSAIFVLASLRSKLIDLLCPCGLPTGCALDCLWNTTAW